MTSGLAASDGLDRLTTGGRLDWSSSRDAVVVTGEAVAARAHALWLPPTLATEPDPALVLPGASEMRGGALLGRWVRTRPGGASMQLQSTGEMVTRAEPVGAYRQISADSEFQYHTPIGARNDLVAGTGFRYVNERFNGQNGYSLVPSQGIDRRFDVFAEDSVALADKRVTLSAGGRVDRETDVGWSVEPSARVMWAVTPQAHRLWAAASRVLRTPSLQDLRIRVDYPAENIGGPLPVASTVTGNPNLPSETMASLDAGYRLSLGAFQFDVAGFRSSYDRLRTSEPGTPRVDFTATGPIVVVPVEFGSLLQADTSGVELSTKWQPAPTWRMTGGYTTFHLTAHPNAASADPTVGGFDANAPTGQWQVQSLWTLGRRTDFDVLVQHVGALRQLGVPAYSRADARVEWRLVRGFSLAIIGQNLTDGRHAEFTGPQSQLLATDMARSVSAKLTWRLK
jgi:iron complex outermembrane receptor protein